MNQDQKQRLELQFKANKVNSKLWCKFNDNSKAARHRQDFLNENGGVFKELNGVWHWYEKEPPKTKAHLPPKMERPSNLKVGRQSTRIRVVENVMTNELIYIDNLSEFCRENLLDRKAMNKLLEGRLFSVGIFRRPGTTDVSHKIYTSQSYLKWIKEHPEDASRDIKAESQTRKLT